MMFFCNENLLRNINCNGEYASSIIYNSILITLFRHQNITADFRVAVKLSKCADPRPPRNFPYETYFFSTKQMHNESIKNRAYILFSSQCKILHYEKNSIS